MTEILFIILMCAAWTVPFAIFIPQWFWMMLTIDGVFAVFELYNKIKYGETLSTRFWKWSVDKAPDGTLRNLWKVIVVISLMLVGWIMLLIHLVWKLIKRDK